MRIPGMLILLATSLCAGPTATLTGRVTDTTGAVMTGAEVQAINVETGVRITTVTNEEGLYRILHLQPGIYRLMFRKLGFQTIVKPGLELRVDDIIQLNFEMQIGSVEQSVTVEEGTPLVEAETGTLSQVIDRNVMAELPSLARNPYDFVALSAGAVPSLNASGSGGSGFRGVGIAINGQRAEAASFLLDGSDNTDTPSTNPGQTVPSEAVREYRILTNSFTAEYGRNAGFVANLVTKSGTNEFHGSAYDYARNSRLAANSFENNARSNPRAVFNRHQPGGSLGGPIMQDKVFFFGSFESILVRSSDSSTYSVPTPQLVAISSPATQAIFRKYPLPANLSSTEVTARTVRPFGGGSPVTLPVFAAVSRIGPIEAGAGQPQNTNLGTLRVDSALGARIMLVGRYAIQDVDQFASVRQPYTADLDQPTFTRNQSATLRLTRMWSAGVVSESRLVYNRYSTVQPEAGLNGLFYTFTIQNEATAQLPTGRQSIGGPRNLYEIHQTANWVLGRHNWKLGGQAVHYRDTREVTAGPIFAGVRPRFPDLQGFVDGRLSRVDVEFDFFANGRLPGDLVQGPVVPADRRGHSRYKDLSWFVQDTWKVTPRLTLTPGIRWEFFGRPYSVGHERTRQVNYYLGEGATYFERFANGSFLRTVDAPGKYRGHYALPDRNNFGPRLGLAYDLSGDGKTVARAGGGIFFNRGYGVGVNTLTGQVSFLNVPFTPEMLENAYSIPGQATGVAPNIGRQDQDVKVAYTSAWNATIEREWGSKVVLSASYVGSSGSGLVLRARENGLFSGRYVGRPNQRLLPNYGAITTIKNLAHSSYHALQLRASSRHIPCLGLQFGANYTWGHSIDNSSAADAEGSGFTQGAPVDPTRPRIDRGNSSFDQRHRFVAHWIWALPAGRNGSGLAKHLAGGWQVSGIASFQTGQPFYMYDWGTLDRDGVSGRPRVAGRLPEVLGAAEMIPDPLSPNRFLYLPANQIRNRDGSCIPNATPFACLASVYDPLDDLLPRNAYTRPGLHFQDVAVSKNIRVRESVRVQLRAEFYNLFNHANRELVPGAGGVPGGFQLSSPAFAGGSVAGVIAQYGGTPRQVVFAAKILF